MKNPFIGPMWLMLAVAIVVADTSVFVAHNPWGLVAWFPWLFTVTACALWTRRHS